MIDDFKTFKYFFKSDIERNFSVPLGFKNKIFNRKYKLLFLLRLATYLHIKTLSDSRIVIKIVNKLIYRIYDIYQFRFGIEISPFTQIGQGLYLPHPNGIIIHPKTILGQNCSILQQVTIGNNDAKGKDNLAVIGNNVSIGAGVKIIGPCSIGDNVVIGANAVVINDIPDNVIVVGVPAKIIREL